MSILLPFTILVDQREKAPYRFTGFKANKNEFGHTSDIHHTLDVDTKRIHIKTGDYTIEGHRDLVTVERKSLPDLYGSVGKNRDRFEAEYERMSKIKNSVVVIEASFSDVCFRPPEPSRMNPRAVIHTLTGWWMKHGVPFFVADTRRGCEYFTLRFLISYWKNFQKNGAA